MRFVSVLALALCGACTGGSAGTEGGTTSTTSSTTGEVESDSSSTDGGETTGGESSTSGESSSSGGESSTGTPACAAPPDPDAAWIPDYVDGIVARLSGAAELTPGVTLPERSTPEHRAATADWLEAEFSALGLEVQRHAYAAQGTNIAARLPATEPGGRTVVIAAHFDAVPGSPGANDNATGVAYVLALARYLSQIECRSHDVLFVGFDQEEIGLVGSDAYAAHLVDTAEDVLAVHTIDQMGWDEDGDRAIELERADPGLYELYEAASTTLPVPVPLQSTNTGFTDHVSFRDYGFEAIGLTEEFVGGDTTPHYHLPSDTYDTVNIDYLVSTCVLGNTAFAMLIDAG